MAAYTPARGDVVWLQFAPQKGHEQDGLRPALTVSPVAYNKKTGLAFCCPVTSKAKGYPYEVAIEGRLVQGVVLSDQMKSLDWRARRAKRIETVSSVVLDEVLAKLATLLDP